MGKKGLLTKGLMALGIIGFLWFSYLLFFCNLHDESNQYWLLGACVIAILYPIGVIYGKGITPYNIKKGLIIAVGCLAINSIYVYFAGYEKAGFIDNLFHALTSEPYRWAYFILLIVASICSIKKIDLSIWVTAILLGILTPVILAAVFYIIVIVLVLVFAVAKVLGSKGSSYSTSSTSNFSSEQEPDKLNNNHSTGYVQDNTSYYSFFIVWSDGVHAPYSCIEKYPRDVSASRVISDLKRKFGSTAKLIDFHIHDPAHDSVLNYM